MKWVVLAAILFLSGCGHIDTHYYGKVDLSDKSITVPAGGKGLKGDIKKYLADSGWKMMVDRGPNVTKGEVGQETNLEQSATFKTRYRIAIASTWFDVCLNATSAYSFDISLIDNLSGMEVFTMAGAHCESEIMDRFSTIMRGKTE